MKNAHVTTLLLAIAMGLAIAGCATRYIPFSTDSVTGYSEFQVDSTAWNVAFRGNKATDMPRINRYLLYRCAVLTRQHGFDYFLVLNYRDTSIASLPYITAHARDTISCPDPLKPGNLPPVDIASIRFSAGSHSAEAMIRMMHGQCPFRNRQAYDARFLLASMGPSIER